MGGHPLSFLSGGFVRFRVLSELLFICGGFVVLFSFVWLVGHAGGFDKRIVDEISCDHNGEGKHGRVGVDSLVV